MGQVDLAERRLRVASDDAVRGALARRAHKLVSSGSVALLLEGARVHQRAAVRMAKMRGWT